MREGGRGQRRGARRRWAVASLIAAVVVAPGFLLSQERVILHEYFTEASLSGGQAGSGGGEGVTRAGIQLPEPGLGGENNGEELTLTPEGTLDPERAPAPQQNGGQVAQMGEVGGLRLDRDTRKEERLEYYTAFNPSVVPFKRGGVLDHVRHVEGVYGLTVRDATLEPRALVGSEAVRAGRERFWGSVYVEARRGQAIPIPSVAADAEILSYEVSVDAAVRFGRDSADNHFAIIEHDGPARLNFLTDAPSTYFGGALSQGRGGIEDVPRALRPARLPRAARRVARDVIREMGLVREAPVGEIVQIMTDYYRGFEATPLDPSEGSGDDYRDITLSKRGVCRHRAFSFIITAHALGIPARYVYNEAHAFVEVYLPAGGGDGLWMRVDLGGDAEGLDVHNTDQKLRHEPEADDALPRPEGYDGSYSDQALNPGVSESGFDDVRGLPQSPSELSPLSEAGGDDAAPEGEADAPGAQEARVGDGEGAAQGDEEGAAQGEAARREAAREALAQAGLAPVDPDELPEGLFDAPEVHAGASGQVGEEVGEADAGGSAAAQASRKQAATIAITAAPAAALRGQPLRITGRLQAHDQPLAGRAVELLLVSRATGEATILRVASAQTDAQGGFEASFELPETIPLGVWELSAYFAGDERYEAARSD